MLKFLKWTVGIIVVLGLLFYFVGIPYIKTQTKKKSPQETVLFGDSINGKNIKLTVTYCKPYKKDRVIFGGLVPFDKVWRTGANENTVFTTNKEVTIDGKKLPVGEYSLWTIPGKDKWTVIWNKKQYPWGIKINGVASREAEHDAIQVEVPVETQSPSLEQFKIAFEKNGNIINLILAWDTTKITVPISL